jgi:FtsP/CotA-like multicopper oxidase with cupredoxin domain
LWVLSDPRIGARESDLTVAPMERMQGREGDVVLINGEARPTLTTKAGSLERWRFVNASASRYYRLALEGHQFSVIASDGGRLTAPVTTAEVLLAPGERTELLVTPTKAGTYRMRALAYDRGSPAMGGGMGGGRSSSSVDVTIATVSVIGDAAAATLPTALATATTARNDAVASTRVVTLAMGGGGGGGGGMGGGGMMGFTIDGKTFDGARTDITATLGTTEHWTIRNTSPMDHPFHIHVWPFEIVDGPATAGWKDTVNVPAKSSVDIRIRFADFAGRTVYHCHILDHEDLGMMGIIEVTD